MKRLREFERFIICAALAATWIAAATAQDIQYANYFRWLETEDEYFPYWGYPGQGRWEIYGLGLPDKILEKVHHGNAEMIFKMYRGEK